MSDHYTVRDVPLGFAPIPPELVMWTDTDGKPLTGTEIRVWSMLSMHRDLMTQKTSAGVVRMSEFLKVDRRTVQRCVNRLIESGFLLYRARGRDPETGTYTPAEFIIAIGGKPMRLGAVVDHGTSASDHGTYHGTYHGTFGDENPSINARAEREGKENRKESTPVGADKPPEDEDQDEENVNYMTVFCEASKTLGYDPTPEDRRDLPKNLKTVAGEGHDDTFMRKVVRRCLAARADRQHPLSPQRARDELLGNVQDLPRRPAKSIAVIGAKEEDYDIEEYRFHG